MANPTNPPPTDQPQNDNPSGTSEPVNTNAGAGSNQDKGFTWSPCNDSPPVNV